MTFQALGNLVLLPLCLVPVLIHWLNRRKPPVTIFPATRFLVQSAVKANGGLKLSDWLLMLVRCIVIAAVILAISKPVWRSQTPTAAPRVVQEQECPAEAATVDDSEADCSTEKLVLVVSGGDGVGEYVSKALSAPRNASVSSPYAVRGCSLKEVIPLLQQCHAVVLAGSIPVSGEEELAGHLRIFAERGGVVICLPGHSGLRQWLWLKIHGLVDCTVRKILDGEYSIESVDETSPLARLFPPEQPSDLFLFSVRRRMEIASMGRRERAVLTFPDGGAALLAHPCQRGVIYLFTFDFSTANTDFVLRQCFLPVIREMVAQAATVEEKGPPTFQDKTESHPPEPADDTAELPLDPICWLLALIAICIEMHWRA